MEVFGLGKNLLFKSILGRCVYGMVQKVLDIGLKGKFSSEKTFLVKSQFKQAKIMHDNTMYFYHELTNRWTDGVISSFSAT